MKRQDKELVKLYINTLKELHLLFGAEPFDEQCQQLAELLKEAAKAQGYEPDDYEAYMFSEFNVSLEETAADKLAEAEERREELEDELREAEATADELREELQSREAWPELTNLAEVQKAETLGAMFKASTIYEIEALADTIELIK